MMLFNARPLCTMCKQNLASIGEQCLSCAHGLPRARHRTAVMEGQRQAGRQFPMYSSQWNASVVVATALTVDAQSYLAKAWRN